MSAATGALGRQRVAGAGRSLRELAARPVGWAVAVVVVVVALAIGSVHPAPPTRTARIVALENGLKCPNCVDLSIRQSDTAAAANLRSEVVRLVDRGETDAQVEATVVAQYGSAELLSPPSSGIDTLAWALPSAALVLGGAALAIVLARRRRAATTLAAPSEADEALVRTALAAPPPSGLATDGGQGGGAAAGAAGGAGRTP
jgi:cytochrome c-type biogenesis protein CcmH